MERPRLSNQHPSFDPDFLFALKERFNGYQYCPRCRAELVPRDEDGKIRMTCPDEGCGFVYYMNPAPAAGAMIIENDSILLVKRAHPPYVGWWCIPAGFMDWKEHPTETAVRELYEETGLKIELTDFFEVYSGDDDPRTNALLILYLAKVIDGEPMPGDDASEVRFFPFDALPEKIAFVAHNQALADYNNRFRDK